jgi:hypothetical protein
MKHLLHSQLHNIVCDYRLDDWDSLPLKRQRTFPLCSVSRPALRPTQPPIQWVPEVFFPGVKRGRVTPSSAEVKNKKELYFVSSLYSGTSLL